MKSQLFGISEDDDSAWIWITLKNDTSYTLKTFKTRIEAEEFLATTLDLMKEDK